MAPVVSAVVDCVVSPLFLILLRLDAFRNKLADGNTPLFERSS
jgi:hypothetical protein